MSQVKLKTGSQDDDLEGVVDDAIRAAGGDMRAAIMGLIRGQHTYEAEIKRDVSARYVRRRLRS